MKIKTIKTSNNIQIKLKLKTLRLSLEKHELPSKLVAPLSVDTIDV